MTGIAVNLADPPAYVVLVQPSEATEDAPSTWPFDTHAEASAAYELAVASGQFTYTMRKATKKKPALVASLVSCWRRETYEGADGRQHVHYVGCLPWHGEGQR